VPNWCWPKLAMTGTEKLFLTKICTVESQELFFVSADHRCGCLHFAQPIGASAWLRECVRLALSSWEVRLCAQLTWK
jgi:hypothetical protein